MKNFIKQKLYEALEDKGYKVLPYDPKPEMKAAGAYPSLSNPSFKLKLNKIRFRMAKAANMASQYKSANPDDNYFLSPTDGDGFYQVEFRHDGQIKTKHIRASADMMQQGGAFQPSDVGTCKTFQNIARYCFVKAGKNGGAVGQSPADDAANKALIIFKGEILDFLGSGSYDDGKSAEISAQSMDDKMKRHKEKKDLETKLGRRLSDSEWQNFLETGEIPKPKSGISMDPEQAAEFEKRQVMAQARIAAAKARMNK
jgi:hypothetical protein